MTAAGTAPGGVHTVRRVITYLLLGVMVLIAGIGLSGLIERAITSPVVLADFGSSGLAQSLAFTLIAGPFALGLWWFAWRSLAGPSGDRHSAAWAVYLVIAHTVSLIVFSLATLELLSSLVTDSWRPDRLGEALAWGLIWVWHHWMWHHTPKGPTRMVGVATLLGSLWGLAVFAGGLVSALSTLFDAATGVAGVALLGSGWVTQLLGGLVWAVGGALLWWWHWTVRDARHLSSGFAGVVIVLVAGVGSVAMVLVGAALTLWYVLRLLFDPSVELEWTLTDLGFAVASLLVGALIWAYHRGFVTAGLREPTRLAGSFVALGVAATGVGVLVNTVLAAFATPLVGGELRSLLLSGVAALVVGAVAWWFVWQPLRVPAAGRGPRRIYLVAVFGVSALVALITLLVVGYRLFEFFLEPSTGGGVLERIRVPLGLLVATVLVAWYHFAMWRGDRAAVGADVGAAEVLPRLRQVTLIAPAVSGADARLEAIRQAAGAKVTLWPMVAEAQDVCPATDAIVAALEGVASERVVIVAGPGTRLDVIPLAE